MPRVIRVNDRDNDISHIGDPGPNRMIENDATMWLDEGGSNAGNASLDIAGLLGYASIDIPEEQQQQISAEAQADLARGVRPDTQEYVESFGGGEGGSVSGTSNFQPSQLGIVQSPPPGAEGAHPDWNTFPENPNNDYINFLPGRDSRVDPAIYEIARRMSVKLGVTLQCNSGYRSRAKNESCGGATSSKHMYGKAMDLQYIGSQGADRQRMLAAAIESGAQGIGLYNSFMHIDLGPKRTWNRPQPSWAASTMSSAGYA